MQYPQRVFTMIAGHTGEVVEDLATFPPARRPITFSHRLFEFSPCRHAQLPRHLLHHPAAPLPGSSLREATAADSVTKIVSQCVIDDTPLPFFRKARMFRTKDRKSEHVEDEVGHYLAAQGLKKISIGGNVFSNSLDLIFKLFVVEVGNWASNSSKATIRWRRGQECGVV